MKITYIANSSIPSTSANSVHVMKMCEAFKKNGINIKLVVPDKGEKELLKNLDEYEFYGIKYKFPTKFYKMFFNSMRGIRVYLYYLYVVWKEYKDADIIFTREPIVSFFCILFRKKHILELHYQLKFVSYKLFKLFKLFKSRYMLNIIVISTPLKNIYLKDFDIDENKISVLPDGVTVENFINISKKPLFKGDINIGYTGSLYKGRGIDIILHIASNLTAINFNIYGGEKEQINYWRDYCKKNGLKNVMFFGHIPNKDVPKVLCNQDILLMPYQKKVQIRGIQNTSSWMSPMKMFEYMASGRIIVSSDLPVLREVLNEKNAYLVTPDDKDEWVNTIKYIIENREEGIKKARQAKIDVLKYTWQNRAKTIVDSIQGKL